MNNDQRLAASEIDNNQEQIEQTTSESEHRASKQNVGDAMMDWYMENGLTGAEYATCINQVVKQVDGLSTKLNDPISDYPMMLEAIRGTMAGCSRLPEREQSSSLGEGSV